MPPLQLPPTAQALLQTPQFFGSLEVSTQTPEQLLCPGGHAHVPPRHAPPTGQELPQKPQFFGSLKVLTQTPPQLLWPGGHWQLPPTQLARRTRQSTA